MTKAVDGLQTVHHFLFGQKQELKKLMHELTENSVYWSKVEAFYFENEEKALGTLKPAERVWLRKIKAELESETES
jgi:hypothetical protein